jgi:hypothetical protein
MLNEGNQIHNFISSSSSGTVINYGSGSDLTSYASGSGFTRQKVPVPVPQHCGQLENVQTQWEEIRQVLEQKMCQIFGNTVNFSLTTSNSIKCSSFCNDSYFLWQLWVIFQLTRHHFSVHTISKNSCPVIRNANG